MMVGQRWASCLMSSGPFSDYRINIGCRDARRADCISGELKHASRTTPGPPLRRGAGDSHISLPSSFPPKGVFPGGGIFGRGSGNYRIGASRECLSSGPCRVCHFVCGKAMLKTCAKDVEKPNMGFRSHKIEIPICGRGSNY